MDLEKNQGGCPVEPNRESVPGGRLAPAQQATQSSKDVIDTAKQYLALSVPVVKQLDDSRNYPRSVKHLVTGVVAACGLATPLGSNIFLPTLSPAARDLHTTQTVMNLSIAMYCLAVAITPMWWTTLAKTYGKRRSYLATFFLFIVFNIVAAESVSAAMFIVMRVFVGATSSPVQALGAGTVADLWVLEERGHGMGIFLLGAMAGNVVGPIVGGALGQRWGWRATQWFMAIYGGCIWFAVLFFLPETTNIPKRPTGEKLPSKDKEASKGLGQRWQSFSASCKAMGKAFASPFSLLYYLKFPPILITVCYTAINFSAYYFAMIVIQACLSKPPYSYSVIIVGICYLPNAAGNLIAALLGGRWMDHTMVRKATAAGRFNGQGKVAPKPQDALGRNVYFAALLYPSAMLISGWTYEQGYVAIPLVFNFFFAVGNMMMQNVTTVTLTEFIPGSPATGVALANLVRNSLGAAICIITQPLLDAIGVGWSSTLVGLVCMGSAGSIWLLQRNATRWAAEMADEFPRAP